MTKKEFILEKAELIFASKGYDATTIRDISKAAKINVAMVSYYFGSKERLIETLFEERMKKGVLSVSEIAADDTLDPLQKLTKIVRGYITKVQNNRNFYLVILAEQATNKNKKILKTLLKYKENYINFFEAIIADGYKQGIFKRKVEGVFLNATLTGTVMQSLINEEVYLLHYGIKKSAYKESEYFDKIYHHLMQTINGLLQYEQ